METPIGHSVPNPLASREEPVKQPHIELIPLRPAVCGTAAMALDVLVRITPPTPEVQLQRPALNLGLVLDRSGSMAAHNKINFAREAAAFAVQQLLPTDRVSVTSFDDRVETLVPNTLAVDKAHIVELIHGVQPGNTTALHGGWQEGGQQVRQHLLPGGLNRVLLLSDGLANVGETNPDAIATDVNRLAREGVSTTTMGLGDDYNENLLEAMAQSGDGNYYYIESPRQLADIFQTELKGLMATFGNTVSLGIEPQAGVTVTDVLNDLDKTPAGRLKLPNLVAGMPVIVVVRLSVPPMTQESELCRFRLAWNEPKRAERQRLSVSLRLPVMGESAWAALAANVEVQERAALLLIARAKKEATRCLERGDWDGARRWLQEAKQLLAAAPSTPEMQREAEALAEIEAHLESGAHEKFQKLARYQRYQRRHSKPYP
jgi:Ca-activated chloride channel family protein